MTTVLVTGGSKGIGRSISKSLCNAGYDVAFTYNQNKELALAIEEESMNLKGSIKAFHMKVENRDSVRKAFGDVESYFCRNIQCLVNNAAIAQEKPFEEITDRDWEEMLSVNLQGAFICSQEVLPKMIEKKWGRIINITSIGGQWGGFNQVHYAASKAGLINLTQSLAKLFSKNGVLTNAIAIGLVETEMSQKEINREDGKQKIEGIPIGRIADLNEVASTVEFLCSNNSSYITGQTINLNGGMLFS